MCPIWCFLWFFRSTSKVLDAVGKLSIFKSSYFLPMKAENFVYVLEVDPASFFCQLDFFFQSSLDEEVHDIFML